MIIIIIHIIVIVHKEQHEHHRFKLWPNKPNRRHIRDTYTRIYSYIIYNLL